MKWPLGLNCQLLPQMANFLGTILKNAQLVFYNGHLWLKDASWKKSHKIKSFPNCIFNNFYFITCCSKTPIFATNGQFLRDHSEKRPKLVFFNCHLWLKYAFEKKVKKQKVFKIAFPTTFILWSFALKRLLLP